MNRFSFSRARDTGQTLLANVIAQGQVAVANFQTDSVKMSAWDKRIFGTILVVAAAVSPARADSVSDTIKTIKGTAFTVGQGLFAIFLIIGLVKTAKKFLGGEPDAITSLMWLLGGVLVFFGFSALKSTITGNAKLNDSEGLIGE